MIDPGYREIAAATADEIARRLWDDSPVGARWLSPREAARYLDVSLETLAQHRAKGTGPRYHKVSDRIVRYDRDSIDSWVESFAGGGAEA